MIQANEVRVGNWVKIGSSNVQIDAVMSWGKIELANAIESYNVNDFEPIPLTEEIMLSMGLMIRPELTPQEAKSNISLWHRNSFFIFHDSDNNFCAIDLLNTFELERKTTICYYVHQLQNLIFALTGEELEINL